MVVDTRLKLGLANIKYLTHKSSIWLTSLSSVPLALYMSYMTVYISKNPLTEEVKFYHYILVLKDPISRLNVVYGITSKERKLLTA